MSARSQLLRDDTSRSKKIHDAITANQMAGAHDHEIASAVLRELTEPFGHEPIALTEHASEQRRILLPHRQQHQRVQALGVTPLPELESRVHLRASLIQLLEGLLEHQFLGVW